MAGPFNTKEFLEVKLNKKLQEHPKSMEGFDCAFQFEIGDEIWNLDLFQSAPQIKPGAHQEPDCTLKMSDENFEKMIRKQLNIPLAILTGKIKIQGERALALKLGKLFS
jgi:putative sterol carrier protein